MPSSKDFSSDKLLQDIQSFMDRMEAKYRRAFLALVESTTRSPELGAILRSINDGSSLSVTPDVYSAIENIDIDTTTLRDLARQAMSGGGKVTAKAVGLEGRFDITNPRAIQYARSVSSELVTGITRTVRQNLRDIIADAVDGSESVAETVRRIKSEVGLTPRYSAAVRNYRKQLIANGKTTKQANQAAEKYAQKLLTQRARTIARTEIAQATNFGQHEFWRQMQDSGDLPPETMRMWITAQDEKTCPICGPMNGELTTIDGSWLTGSGPLEEPHAHPNCRCTSGLVFPTKLKKNDPLGWEHWLISKHESHDQSTHGNRGKTVPLSATAYQFLGDFVMNSEDASEHMEVVKDKGKPVLRIINQEKAVRILDDILQTEEDKWKNSQGDQKRQSGSNMKAIKTVLDKVRSGDTKNKTQKEKDAEVDSLSELEYELYSKAPSSMKHDDAIAYAKSPAGQAKIQPTGKTTPKNLDEGDFVAVATKKFKTGKVLGIDTFAESGELIDNSQIKAATSSQSIQWKEIQGVSTRRADTGSRTFYEFLFADGSTASAMQSTSIPYWSPSGEVTKIARDSIISKHGRHDQKTHGHRFGSRGEVLTESMAVPPKNIITRPGYLGRDAGDKYLSGIFGVTGMAPHPDEVEVGDELFDDAIPERLFVVEQVMESVAKRGVQLDDAAREHMMGLSHRQQDVFFSHLITGEPATALGRAIAATATKGGSVQFMPGVTKPLKLKHKTQARKDEEVDALNDTEYARYEKAPEGMSHDMALTRAVMGKKAFEVAYGLAERTAPKPSSPSAPKVFEPNKLLGNEKYAKTFGKDFEIDHAIRGLNAAEITATRTLPKSVKVGTANELEISNGDEVRAWFVLTNRGEIHPAGYADQIVNQKVKAMAFFPLKVEVVSGAMVPPTTIKRTFKGGVTTTSKVPGTKVDYTDSEITVDADKLVNAFQDSNKRYAFESGVIEQMPSYNVREGVFTISIPDISRRYYDTVLHVGGTITSASQPLSKSSVVKHGQHDQSTHGKRGNQRASGIEAILSGAVGEPVDVEYISLADAHKLTAVTHGKDPHPAFASMGRIGQQQVGSISWDKKTGKIYGIATAQFAQRKGVATAIFNYAKDFATQNGLVSPVHSDTQTSEGAAWARKVGKVGLAKHGQHDQSTHGHRGASSTRVAQSTEDAFAKSFAMQGSQSNLTPEESLALEDYKVSSYQDVNDHLRGVKRKLTLMEEKLGFGQMSTDEIVKAVGNLDKAFEKTSVSCDKPTEVFRGMSLPKDAWHSKIKAGDVIEDLGFVSTSQSKNSASRFSSPTAQTEQVIFTIKLPTGTKMMAGDSSEFELVLNRGTKMRVSKVDTWTSGTSSEKTGYNIEVEVVK